MVFQQTDEEEAADIRADPGRLPLFVKVCGGENTGLWFRLELMAADDKGNIGAGGISGCNVWLDVSPMSS